MNCGASAQQQPAASCGWRRFLLVVVCVPLLALCAPAINIEPSSEELPKDINSTAKKKASKKTKNGQQPGSSDEEITSAYWNSWFLQQGKEAQDIVVADEAYTFHLDISPFDYASLVPSSAQSAHVDPGIEDIINRDDLKSIRFRVKALIPEGSGLRWDGEPDQNFIDVDLQRLREPKLADAQSYATHKISLTELSQRAGTGYFTGRVFAEEPGCSAIILSIMTENGRMPLDHLVRRIAISKPGAPKPQCEEPMEAESAKLHSGLQTLLDTSISIRAGGAPELAAAAFHIFDTGVGNFVIFVDGRPDASPQIHAWQTNNSLLKYISEPMRLPALIDEARKLAGTGQQGSYIKAARELASLLFSGQGSNGDRAKAARSAFESLVAQSQSARPVVVARISSDKPVGGQNQSFFAPLGILGAQGPNSVLQKPITVVQPLPRERYTSAQTCVGDWTFAVPDKLDTVTDLPLLLPDDRPGWLQTLANLKHYFSAPEPRDTAEGFLLLAHHAEGMFWYEKHTERVLTTELEREFAPGSVGIFAACSVASPATSAFIRDFNESGIDAIIASPFAVPGLYGAVLAIEFTNAVEGARKSSIVKTIADIFGEAIERAAARMKDKYSRNYEEMGYEFVILGNPGLKVCNPSAGQN
jgi:hypothetical protein